MSSYLRDIMPHLLNGNRLVPGLSVPESVPEAFRRGEWSSRDVGDADHDWFRCLFDCGLMCHVELHVRYRPYTR